MHLSLKTHKSDSSNNKNNNNGFKMHPISILCWPANYKINELIEAKYGKNWLQCQLAFDKNDKINKITKKNIFVYFHCANYCHWFILFVFFFLGNVLNISFSDRYNALWEEKTNFSVLSFILIVVAQNEKERKTWRERWVRYWTIDIYKHDNWYVRKN